MNHGSDFSPGGSHAGGRLAFQEFMIVRRFNLVSKAIANTAVL